MVDGLPLVSLELKTRTSPSDLMPSDIIDKICALAIRPHLAGKVNGCAGLAVGKFLELRNAPFSDLISFLNFVASLLSACFLLLSLSVILEVEPGPEYEEYEDV